MEPTSQYRPSVSRETRRLLLAGALAVAALWVLARIRFEDRPVTPNPVPALLGQLSAPPSYDDLAETLAQLQARLAPSLVAFDATDAGGEGRAALRWREGVALVVLARPDGGSATPDPRVIAYESATGLAVVRVAPGEPVDVPPAWTPRREQQPRYLFATDLAAAAVTLRPVYVGVLAPVTSLLWPEPVWAVPAGTGLTPGALVFSSNAEFAGVVVADGAGAAIVPPQSVLAAATRLLATPGRAPSTLGVEVQGLTPAVAALTGAAQGVVVTWVAATGGEAAAPLQIGDVIEAVDGQPILSPQQWEARSASVPAGERANLRVRRNGQAVAVAVTAAPRAAASRALGVGLRAVPGTGAEVTRVDSGSAGARAGLQRGDLITRVAAANAPAPAQITRAFAGLPDGQRVLLAVTRGDTHHVLVLGR